MADPIHVLVASASAVTRVGVGELLAKAGGLRISLAGDAEVVAAKLKLDCPDVILLDLRLPQTEPAELIRRVAGDAVAVVVCTSDGVDSPAVRRALHAGAVGAIAQIGSDGGEPALRALVSAITNAHRHRALRRRGASDRAPARPLPRATAPARIGRPSRIVVAIGASTGGTEALAQVLPALPADFPGVVIVQHMPPRFTHDFAERLNTLSAMAVSEASDGDVIADGRVLVAAGGRQLRVVRHRGRFAVEVFDGPEVGHHCPSVDVLFHSVAQAAGRDAIGLILTGMGADGADGLVAIRSAGGHTIGQDEASSTVYGMPRVAAERGGVNVVAGLDRIAAALIESAASLQPGSGEVTIAPPSRAPTR